MHLNNSYYPPLSRSKVILYAIKYINKYLLDNNSLKKEVKINVGT